MNPGSSSSSSSSSSSRDHNPEALRKACEEGRYIVDHQIQTLNDIDQKASSTLRISAIFLGLLLTVGSLLVGSDKQFQQFISVSSSFPTWFLITISIILLLGISLLIFSMMAAIKTYSSTEFDAGVSHDAFGRLIDKKYTETEWLVLLARTYPQWIESNEESNQEDSKMLEKSHKGLYWGIGFVFASIFLYVLGTIIYYIGIQ